MSLVPIQAEFLLDFCRLIQFANSQGFLVTSGELLRTIEQQQIYLNTGRSKTLKSPHLDKLAGDLQFFKNGVYINGLPPEEAINILKPIGQFWESLHPKNRWGGNFDKDYTRKDPFVDVPHFERQV